MSTACFCSKMAIMLMVIFLFPPPAWAACPSNSERWYKNGTPLCRCISGYIKNRGRCVSLHVGSARARALELKREERSDCHAMAQIYNEFAYAVAFDSRTLVNYAREILGNENSPSYVRFSASGFRPQYQDPSNQVRHFATYFHLGVTFSSARLGKVIANLIDRFEPADIKLGKAASALGSQTKARPRQMAYLGEAIRSQVCR